MNKLYKNLAKEILGQVYFNIYKRYLNDNGNLLDNKIVRIEGDEYNAWGDDDNYITNLVLTKLGLTKTV